MSNKFSTQIAAQDDLTKFYDYVLAFYGKDSELYPQLAFTKSEIILATAVYLYQVDEFVGDSVDRECIRDLVLSARKPDTHNRTSQIITVPIL